jgi:hypothetical protein
VLAYLSWHCPAPSIEPAVYEHALEQFHRSLAHRPPTGFRGSMAFRTRGLPGAPEVAGPAYEDWYLLEDWTAVGVLEEAAVSQGHVSVHDKLAARAHTATGAIYRLLEGHAELAGARLAVWVERPRGHERPSLEALLGDGLDSAAGSLWRRCLGLGPAPELCLLAAEAPAGVATARLPKGWAASTLEREALWHG